MENEGMIDFAGHPQLDQQPHVEEDCDCCEFDDNRVEEEEDFTGEGKYFGASKPWMGCVHPPSNWDPENSHPEHPNLEVELECVHGYHGRGCRDNVKWVECPDIFLYPAAAIIVCYKISTKEQTIFREHDEDVTCLDYHKDSRIGVSGGIGKRNTAPIFVWKIDSETREFVLLHSISGFHELNVTSIALSPDASRLVSLGMDKNYSIAVYSTKSGMMISSTSGDSNKVIGVRFNTCDYITDPNQHVVSVGFHHLKIWTIARDKTMSSECVRKSTLADEVLCTVCTANDFIFAGALSGNVLVVGYQATPKGPQYTQLRSFPAHPSQVCTLVKTRKWMVSGGKDGIVKYWDYEAVSKGVVSTLKEINVGQLIGVMDLENGIRAISFTKSSMLVGTMLNHIYVINEDGSHKNLIQSHWGERSNLNEGTELWGLDAHPTERRYCSLGGDGVLRMWDADQNLQINMHIFSNPGICCAFSQNGQYIACGFGTGHVVIVDGDTLDPLFSRKRKGRVTAVRFSPDLRYLAAATSALYIDIYDVTNEFQLCGICTGHNAVIQSIDWNMDSTVIMSSSKSYEVLYHSIPECRQVTHTSLLRDEAWCTETSLFHWNVQGVWQMYEDGSSINSLCRSLDKKYVVTCSDDQMVRLFKSPCIGYRVKKGRMSVPAPSIELKGHSSHVTAARWLAGSQQFITCGGADTCIFRWRIKEKAPKHGDAPRRSSLNMSSGSYNNNSMASSMHQTKKAATSYFGHSVRIPQDSTMFGATQDYKSRTIGGTGNEAAKVGKQYQFCPLRVDVGSIKSRVLQQTQSSAMMAAEARKQRQHIEKTKIHKCSPLYPV